MVDEIEGRLLVRADSQPVGLDVEVGQLRSQQLAVVTEVRHAVPFPVIELEAGLTEGPGRAVGGIVVSRPEGISERQSRFPGDRGGERAAHVKGAADEALAADTPPGQGRLQPVGPELLTRTLGPPPVVAGAEGAGAAVGIPETVISVEDV